MDRHEDRYEKVAQELVGIARSWLEHGLDLGSKALDAVADGVRATSDGLGHLAQIIEEEADEIEEEIRSV
jgi:hypothetical protein